MLCFFDTSTSPAAGLLAPMRSTRLLTLARTAGFLSLSACASVVEFPESGATGTMGSGGDPASGSGGGSGAGSHTPSPFRAVSAEFLSAGEIRVWFSDEVADPSPVNPQRFRLRYAYEDCYIKGCEGTLYHDPTLPITGTTNPFVAMAKDPSNQTALLLELEVDMPSRMCEFWEDWSYYQFYDDDYGLMLHHGTVGVGPVEDVHGNPLDPFGESWANSSGLEYLENESTFSEMDVPLLIPCTKNAP
jgi:hypothetical protein